MKVIYPVLFYEEKEGGYSIFVPDLEKALNTSASTCGNTLEESMSMAEDLIAGLILDAMEENLRIPPASKIEDVSFEELEKKLDIENWDYISRFKTYISVDINSFAEKWGKELIKKTVNIPKWVNTKAEDLKINFSKTLEEALLEKIYKS
jgi:predicted RNase H-like HicB family nuclease